MRQIATYLWLHNHYFYIYQRFRGCPKRYFSEINYAQRIHRKIFPCVSTAEMVTVRSQDHIWFIVQALTEMKSLEYWKRCQLLTRNVLGVIRLYTTVKIFCDCCWTIKIRLGPDLRNYTHKSNIRIQNPKPKPVSKSIFNLLQLAKLLVANRMSYFSQKVHYLAYFFWYFCNKLIAHDLKLRSNSIPPL